MKFTKMHGTGNDFVVVDGRNLQADWPSLARAMSDRHFGVGSDGLLVVATSEVAPVRMRMFNPDGSEAEMCGNGIRCFAKYVLEQRIVQPNGPLSVETGAGVLTVHPRWEKGRVRGARVAMGQPQLRPEDVPVNLPPAAHDQGKRVGEAVLDFPVEVDGHHLLLTFVSMGNPHAVAFISEPVEQFPLEIVGPQMEHHSMFPNRTNFEVVNVFDSGRVKARVWERGAGLTLACGSGACALAVAARLHDYSGDQIEVELPGGTLTITWDGRGEVYLEGPAEEVFQGEWPSE